MTSSMPVGVVPKLDAKREIIVTPTHQPLKNETRSNMVARARSFGKFAVKKIHVSLRASAKDNSRVASADALSTRASGSPGPPAIRMRELRSYCPQTLEPVVQT